LLDIVWQKMNVKQSASTMNHSLQVYPNAVDSVPLLRTDF